MRRVLTVLVVGVVVVGVTVAGVLRYYSDQNMASKSSLKDLHKAETSLLTRHIEAAKPSLVATKFNGSSNVSAINLPILIPMDVLLTKLDHEIDPRMEGVEKDVVGSLLRNDTLEWWLERGKIDLKHENGILKIHTPWVGLARLKGKVLMAKVSTHVDLEADLNLELRPELTEVWTLEPNWLGAVEIHKAELEILNKDFDVKSKISRQANKAFDKALEKQRKKLASSAKIGEQIAKRWGSLYRVRQLPGSSLLWSTMEPLHLRGQPFAVSDAGLNFVLGLDLASRILLQYAPPLFEQKHLPIASFEPMADAQLSLNVLTLIELDVLASSLKSRFLGRVLDEGDKSLELMDISLESGGERLLIGLDVVARYKGITTCAQLYLWAEVALEGSAVRFNSVDFDLETTNFLASELAWLAKPRLLEHARKALVVDLADQIDDAKGKASEALERLLEDLPPMSTLAGRITEVSIQALSLNDSRLYFTASASTELTGQIILDEI